MRLISSRGSAIAYLLALQFFYAWAWSSSDVLRPLFGVCTGFRWARLGQLIPHKWRAHSLALYSSARFGTALAADQPWR